MYVQEQIQVLFRIDMPIEPIFGEMKERNKKKANRTASKRTG